MTLTKIFYKPIIIFSQLLLIAFVSNSAVRAAGEVDRSFSAAVQNGLKGSVQAVVKQADGKILVGGQFTVVNNSGRVAVVRLNPDGTVDQTFNAPDFYATTNAGFRIDAVSVGIAVQADGKILINGNFVRVNDQTAKGLLRLNADGSIDASFNADLPTGIPSFSLVKIQSDNKIIVFVSPNNGGVLSPRLIRLNSDGSRDTSFQELVDRVSALEIQPDGKILIGTDSEIYRLNANGNLDISYNRATIQFSNAYKFVLLPNGQILVGGAFRSINNIMVNYIARLNADGTVDTTFNPGGSGANSTIFDLDVLPDGKIVIGGSFFFYNGVSRRGNARLNSDGTLDTTFNYIPGNNSTTIYTVVSNGDGKVYLGGSDVNNLFEKLVRLNSDGTRDTTFNVAFYQPGSITQVLSQPDGKVIVSGNFTKVYGFERRYIARFNADGGLDNTFNPAVTDSCFGIALQPDGKIFCGLRRLNQDGTIDSSFQPPSPQNFGLVYKILIQPDGKILFGGGFSIPGSPVANVIRLNANGSDDTTFNKIIITQSGTTTVNPITGMKLQADGKIVITGNFTQINNVNRGRIARFNSDGTIDTTFFSTVGANGDIYDLTIQSDGKIVIGGGFSSVNGVNNVFYLVRLLPDSNLDTTFVGNPNAPVYAVEKQSDDKILIGGLFNAVSGISHPYLARLNPNGSPDSFGGIGPNDVVLNINASSNGKILIGGNFTRVDNFSTISVARLFSAATPAARTPYDFDGDGRADISVWRPSNGTWYLQQSTAGFTGYAFGAAGDLITPADYDYDGKTDIAVFRPSNGTWYLQRSSLGFTAVSFGASGDIPMPGDFDRDGRADLAVFRPSNGIWYIQQSTNGFTGVVFGVSGDNPVAADYDGDGKTDLAVFRPSNGVWYIQRSTAGFIGVAFGAGTDKPVPADYNGDGKADIAIFRPSTGYWYTSTDPQINYGAVLFGANGDLPVPADYDGDGRADLAVFRPGNGVWYLNRSTQGFTGVLFGISEDKPIPNAFVR